MKLPTIPPGLADKIVKKTARARNQSDCRIWRIPAARKLKKNNNNRLLIEREGRIGKYWAEVVAVRTERSEVGTATTEGQCSTVGLEQARLVSCLLYGTRLLIVKCTSGGLHLKPFRRDVFFMTRAPQTEASYHEFQKQIY